MSSNVSVSGLVVNTLGLTSGFATLIGASPSMTANISFTFPPGTGPTGYYLQNSGGGICQWVPPSNLAYQNPVANNDFYRIRTNELLTGNVVTGIGGNSGGVDTNGGTSYPYSNSIQNIVIVTQPRQGVLTITGGTGGFTYRSNPRYTGLDFFTYYVTDSAGFTSLDRATCTISVENNPPLGNYTGPYFIYGTTSNANVIQYNNGTQTTLFTATFPGGPTGAGVGTLATNRDDNLIYYCSVNATGVSMGRIYAYDYVNNYDFLLIDAKADSRFVNNSVVDFDLSAAAYNNSMLYIAQNSTGGTGIYKLALGPYGYTAGIGGTQQVRGVMYTELSSSLISPSFTWDSISMKLLAIGSTASTGRMTLFNTSAALELYSITGTFLSNRKITTGPDTIFYTAAAGTATVRDITVYGSTLGTTYASLSSTAISSMAEYVSQPV